LIGNAGAILKQGWARFRTGTDLHLLIFLLLLLNVSLAVKLLALIFIFATLPRFRFRQHLKDLPLFYPAMALLALCLVAANAYRGVNYLVLGALSVTFWVASFLVLHQLRCRIMESPQQRLHNALRWFYLINFAATFLKLFSIMIEIGEVNPYVYVGQNFRYFASTGDHLRGITGDISTVNMVLNAFGIFYFLYRRDYGLSLACFLVALVTTSNVGNFILFGTFLYVIIFHREKLVKSIAICYAGLLIAFVVKISPSNLNYLNNKFAEIFHLEKKPIRITYEDHREKDQLISRYVRQRKSLPDSAIRAKKDITDLIAQSRQIQLQQQDVEDSVSVSEEEQGRLKFVRYFEQHYGDTMQALNKPYYASSPGKVISFRETIGFVSGSIVHLLFGAGPGNFSSRLAFKATGLGLTGRYPEKLTYVSPEFRAHHLKLTIRYYLMSVSEHSVINFPNSVFNQLLGEYGLLGLLFFLVLYLWYFVKRIRLLTYGKILLGMLCIFLLLDYWFESLSIVVMFELMALMDIERNKTTTPEHR
jgi:hypothetical protein